ncbi:3-isopropylmalate dehydratase small subunit [Methanocaldococcus villosus KIN24-T80]|uniref:Methanogen homoaconitase small subunit n=1 Tax=Methanocaldococcus villosus KIN24-T80 TaxID=1069083 RepID=N6UUN5_9EURY|nr:homoaconitase small subunit [Methanocaldococcus villosus]ENN96049.1 3-isopropylmalate dehydratase small subunit [Methanocaldococcus villosus KIN24-T80]
MRGIAYKLGDDVDTDAIIPGPYLRTTDPNELARYCLYGIDKDFYKKAKGKIIVAGENFGCGSSREQAVLAIKYAGVKAVVAKSFARIFYRNAINNGLYVITANTDEINDGDELFIDLKNEKIIINNKKTISCKIPKGIEKEILEAGGLINYYKKKKVRT